MIYWNSLLCILKNILRALQGLEKQIDIDIDIAVSQVLKELRDSRDQSVLEEAEAKKDLKGPQVREELMRC